MNRRFLLKGVAIERNNQVWCSDITYIGLTSGFVYLFALMDWFSRLVLASELSKQPGKRFLRARKTSAPWERRWFSARSCTLYSIRRTHSTC